MWFWIVVVLMIFVIIAMYETRSEAVIERCNREKARDRLIEIESESALRKLPRPKSDYWVCFRGSVTTFTFLIGVVI